MRRRAISFMCEHTAEYALVWDLASAFGHFAGTVVPFYFWSSREGASMSLACSDARPVRVVAAYARRPKVIGRGCPARRMSNLHLHCCAESVMLLPSCGARSSPETSVARGGRPNPITPGHYDVELPLRRPRV